MMTRPESKRAKMDVTSAVTKSYSLELELDAVVSTESPPFVLNQMGPSLERIPDDVLLEIVSHLPTFDESLRMLHPKYVIPSTNARTHTLRALSKTSRLLRSRCLAMAWRNVALCGINLRKSRMYHDMGIGEATKTAIRVLNTCPYLLPLIQTVFVALEAYYRKAKIMSELADCLATMPNLDTMQVIYAESRMQTVIKNGFRGKQFPSVRKISLHSSAHEIIRGCPNVEEITCVNGDGTEIIQTLVEAKCHRLHILSGISAPLTSLADLLPNLTHASMAMESDMTPLTNFPFLDTIEILVARRGNLPLSELAALDVKKAREILKGNESQAEKTVVLTDCGNFWTYRAYESNTVRTYLRRETVRV